MAIDISSLTKSQTAVQGLLVKGANGNISIAPLSAEYLKFESDGKTAVQVRTQLETDIQTNHTLITQFLQGEATDNNAYDRLVELVTAINNNKDNIDALVSDKVNKTSIVTNLTTDDDTKVLAASQGKALKDSLDSLSATVSSTKLAAKVITALPDSAVWPSDMRDDGIMFYVPEAAASGD